MAIYTTLYNVFFKRSSSFALTIMIGAYIFETGIDEASNAIFESVNKGKLWKDIKDNYAPKED